MVRLKAIINKTAANINRFQFLMVRLKVFDPFLMRLYLTISIPYGAIKSYHHFHFISKIVNFNSLWCD